MNISIVITVLNEAKSISRLIESLVNQTKKPYEIIIVDGGSTDNTFEIVNHYCKKYSYIKVIKKKSSRSKGRNFGIEIAKGEIIAITDAGCVADKNWLKNLVEPLINTSAEVSAGFYKMISKNDFQKAESLFLGILPNNFSSDFLPSSRSIAFKKTLWEQVGGYPENLDGAGEDMAFNYKVIKVGAKIAREKSAIVEWELPGDVEIFFSKIYSYAKGDAESKVLIFPTKGIESHNVKAIIILVRYLFFLALLIYGLFNPIYFLLFVTIFGTYLLFAYRKVYIEFRKRSVAVWGIILQLTCDMAVISGFTSGLWDTIKR